MQSYFHDWKKINQRKYFFAESNVHLLSYLTHSELLQKISYLSSIKLFSFVLWIKLYLSLRTLSKQVVLQWYSWHVYFRQDLCFRPLVSGLLGEGGLSVVKNFEKIKWLMTTKICHVLYNVHLLLGLTQKSWNFTTQKMCKMLYNSLRRLFYFKFLCCLISIQIVELN